MIWFGGRRPPLEEVQKLQKGTINEHIGVQVSEIGDDYLCGTMPVDERTRQPYGVLHGGATVVLAETLGSISAALSVDPARYRCMGLEVNANHLRAVREGIVTGTARPFHQGRTTQVWGIEVTDEEGRRTAVCRITMAVLDLQARAEARG
ncbi:MAG TPA: hotdog fold thioesterase [Woeseiaceae bacterium]|jgi:1,4-dihydroxy-2-naphthoyl-CoA hydrolase|nr:hotdog fold thioesterase [Woeseiaceae bacterium]